MASSPGSYKGVVIKAGTDAEISAQLAAIDKAGTATTVTTPTKTTTTTSPTKTTTSSGSNDAFLSALQSKLMGMSDMVSSSSTALEKSISSAIAEQRKGTAAGSQAIGMAADREIAAERSKFASSRDTFLESQRGFATNAAALTQLDTRTEKSLRDLEQRKQELILQNDAAGASKIADMQFKALEFRERASQQAFSNILNMGQFAMSMRAEERAAQQFTETLDFQRKQFEFTQSSKMADIATEFGVTLQPGETLETLTARVAPLASAKRKAEMAKLLESTEKENNDINTTGYLMDALLGQGSFIKEDGSPNPQPPASAALSVANYLRQLGIKVTPAMLDQMTAEANRINDQRQTITAKVTAEETGKSFYSTGASLFGPNFQAAITPKPQQDMSKLGNFSGGAYSVLTPQTTAFQSLFSL